MKYRKIKLVSMLFLGFSFLGLKAQQAIPVTGGDASGSGGSVSYSIAQLVFTTNSGTNGSLSQGVQQPLEISVLTDLEEPIGITLQCAVYPNPTNGDITLRLGNVVPVAIRFLLNDAEGKLIETNKVYNYETTISMGNQVAGTYYLMVFREDQKIKTFKLVKQ